MAGITLKGGGSKRILYGLVAVALALLLLLVAYQIGLLELGRVSEPVREPGIGEVLPVETRQGEITPMATFPPGANFVELLSSSEPSACFECHDRDDTKLFHVPERIMKIDDRKGIRRRVCVDCHGPLGVDSTEQMTDLRDIRYDPAPGENGLFELSLDVPHLIHREKILADEMKCMDCHMPDLEKFIPVFPQADVEDGQVLFCQNCKAEGDPHPERGNYIAIHVEKGGRKCTICHVGKVLDIHKRATDKLGAP